MRIHLIRHGQTSWNKERRLQGQTDILLDEMGQEQAEGLVTYFTSIRLAAVYASELQRAQETAQRATQRKYLIITIPQFNERRYGILEGTTIDAISREVRTQLRDSIYSPEGGESHAMMEQRVREGIEKIVASHTLGNEIAIFGHKGTNFHIISHLMGVEQARVYRAGENCQGVVLAYKNQWSIERTIG